jgi:hypothetical protein
VADLRLAAVTLTEAGHAERGTELVRVAEIVEQLLER